VDDFFNARKTGEAVNLPDCLDATFTEFLIQLVDAGALVSVGTTRDGGALSLTVTYDGEWRREYLTSSDEIHEYMKFAAVSVEARGGRPPAPTDPRSRNRGRRRS